MERRPIILDTCVVLRDIARALDNRPSVYGQIVEAQPGGVFITTDVAREIPRKIPETKLFANGRVNDALCHWYEVLGPKLRVVEMGRSDIAAHRVRVVDERDGDDWSTAALADALTPALVLTDNVSDLAPVMGPKASSDTTDLVAIAAKDLARYAEAAEAGAFGTTVGTAMATDALKALHRQIGKNGMFLLAAIGIAVIVIYRRPLKYSAEKAANAVGSTLVEIDARRSRSAAEIQGTITSPTWETTARNRLARAAATAGTFTRTPHAISMRLRGDGLEFTPEQVLAEAQADRWLSVEDGMVFLGTRHQSWREIDGATR